MIKGIISLLISILMTLSPFSVLGNNVASETELKNDGFSVDGGSSVGNILSKAFADAGEGEEVDGDVCIKDVSSDDNTVTVDLTNKEKCSVLVGIYDEESSELISDSSKEVLPSEDQSVEISFDEKLPENYVVKAVAVDENNEAICNVYTDNDNAKWYKDFISSTVNDYSENRVINFDSAENDNFAVLNDDVVLLSDDNTSLTVSDDDKDYSVSLNDKTKDLKKGDIIAYNTDDSENAVIGKITKLSADSNSINFNLESPELDETFDIVKIHYEEKEAVMYDKETDDFEEEINLASTDDNLLSTNAVTSGSVSGGGSVKKTWSFKYGSITFSAGATAVLEYNVWNKYAFTVLTVTPTANLHINVSYSANKEIKVGEVNIPVVPGVSITVPVTVVVKFSASITFDTTITAKFGFSWSTVSGVRKLSTKPTVNSSLKIEGHFYIGIKISPSIDLLWGICKGGITGQAGAQLNATAEWNYSTGRTEKHDCGIECIYCDVDVPLSVSAYLKISALGWTPVDKTWTLWSTTFNDVITFHYSIKYREFGWGPCDHMSYLTTIKVVDQSGNPIKNAKVDDTTVGSNGTVQKWYSDGRHAILIKASGYSSKNFKIGVSSSKTYVVKLNKGSSTMIDDESDASYSKYTKKKKSYNSNGSSGGYYVEPLTYTEPLSGVVLSTAVSGQRRSDVAWVQRELKKLGYFNSEPDGYYGYSTADAVRRFQQDYDLPITGKVNKNVVEVIKKPLKMVSAPQLKLTSAAKITNGDIVSVSWDAVAGASEYNIYVYNSSGKMVANAIGTKATNAAFVLYESGTYTIKAEAKNDRFTSSVSTLGTAITVTAPLEVTFENWDGTILCKQFVAYGSAAVAPAAPEREGYTFSKWDTDYSKVTKDNLIIRPIFTRNQYTVKFLNTDGNEIVTDNNKYYFGENAIAPDPDSLLIPTGYKFIGWDRSFDNICENITVKPVLVWENDDIPIIIDDYAVEKDEGYGYNVILTVRNYEKKRTSGRVVVALKSADEQFVTMTESSAFTLKKSDLANNIVSKETMELFVPCNVDIAYVDIYVVSTYDDLIPISDTERFSFLENETEQPEATESYSGQLDSSLAGKRAILFIYKIGDASDFTNEFVGQTVIDENGRYTFNYNLREAPSVETGDFYVMLGVEGSEKAIFLEKIESPKPEYVVVFKDYDGSVIKTETVIHGNHATLPENNPERDGYIFAGWDYTNSAIYEDVTITAIYVHKTYNVIFIDWTNRRFDAQTYYYGEPLITPDLSSLDDYNAIGWENVVEGMPVTQNMVITAKYEKKVFTVNFYDYNGNIIDTQLVEYGESADVPSLDTESYNFFGWDNENLECVTCSMDVKPYFSYSEDTSNPYANIESGIFTDSVIVTLMCDEYDSDIYYSVDGSEFVLYTEPIIINKTSTLEYYSSSFGKNNSDIVSDYYIINRANDESAWMVPVSVFKNGKLIGRYLVKYGSTLSENELYSEEYGYNFLGFGLNEDVDDVIPTDYSFVSETNLYIKDELKVYTVVFKDSNGNIIDTQEVAYLESASEPEVVVDLPNVIFVGWDTDDYLCVTDDIVVNAVTVNEKDYLSVNLNRESYTMMEGYSFDLSATITGETESELFWSSSDESIAIVDENGKVTALSDGTVVITASLLGTGVSKDCFINILKNEDMSITLVDDSKFFEYQGYICGVSPSDNSVSSVKSQFSSSVDLYNGEVKLTDTDIVSTGTVIKMFDDCGNEIDSATIIVIGDVNSDGLANLQDASHISKFLVNKETLNDVSLIAADVNGDGKVDNKDASMIMRYQASKEQI